MFAKCPRCSRVRSYRYAVPSKYRCASQPPTDTISNCLAARAFEYLYHTYSFTTCLLVIARQRQRRYINGNHFPPIIARMRRDKTRRELAGFWLHRLYIQNPWWEISPIWSDPPPHIYDATLRSPSASRGQIVGESKADLAGNILCELSGDVTPVICWVP